MLFSVEKHKQVHVNSRVKQQVSIQQGNEALCKASEECNTCILEL